MNEHRLSGCRPVPLAYYLKALGVLRLVSEQADPGARGRWERDVFVLETRLTRDELEVFLRERYAPTPLVGPWGARSGFYPGGSEKSAREALDAILASAGPGAVGHERLAPFRAVITAVKELLDDLGIGAKDDVKDRKDELMQACRARLPDEVLGWLDACYVLTSAGNAFPPILGTGGNEGSGSYTSGFARQVVECMIERRHDAALAQALWDQEAAGQAAGQTPGHFLPGAVEGKGQLTAWDYLLCLEGALSFAAALVRRGPQAREVMAAPFTVRAVRAGYGSAAAENSRGEMWLPLWERAVSAAELAQLLREGRVELGRRAARDGTDFARAVSTLGVDRGITAFQRYGILERNGLSYFATPLDRLQVAYRQGVTLLDEIDRWLDSFRRRAAGERAPASAGRALRNLDEAVFDLCRRDDGPRLRAVLVALGQCERVMASSQRWAREAGLGPVPTLSPAWLERCENTIELRLAAALASVSVRGRHGGRTRWLRRNLEPVQVWSLKGDARLAVRWRDEAERDVVWGDGAPAVSLARVLSRRLLADQQAAGEPMYRDSGVLGVDLGDVSDFIEGQVDERALAELIWGCALLDWGQIDALDERPLARREPSEEPWPGAFYGLLKLCFAGQPVCEVKVPLVPRIQRLAAAGRGGEASRAAVRRLRASGLAPAVPVVDVRGDAARRVAAALLFPLGVHDLASLARRVLRPGEVEAPSAMDDTRDTSEQGALT